MVFTNGNADGWSGGSYYDYMDLVGPGGWGAAGDASTSSAANQAVEQWPGVASSAGGIEAASEDAGVGDEADAQRIQIEAVNGGMNSTANEAFRRPGPAVAFVVYDGASHCSDLNSYNFDNPAQPAEYKQQRAQAMDYAVSFAHRYRSSESTKQ